VKKMDIDGPGARSGRLRPGDRVLALNGKTTAILGRVNAALLLAHLYPGDKVDILVE